jgi:hypothetical protein
MIRRTSDLHPISLACAIRRPAAKCFPRARAHFITNLTNGRSCPDSAGVPFEALVGIQVD